MTPINENAKILAVSCFLMLGACGTKQSPSDFVPDVPGEGNFVVCLDQGAAENNLDQVVIPSGSTFQSWGPLTAPLAQGSRDPDWFLSEQKQYWTVITAEEITLNSGTCKRLSVKQAHTYSDESPLPIRLGEYFEDHNPDHMGLVVGSVVGSV